LIKLQSFRERAFRIKIRTKLFLLILVAGMACLTLFRYLWHEKWAVYYFLSENLPSNIRILPVVDEDFWRKLEEEALNYEIPDSEDDKEAVKAIEPFFSLADEYTSIAIYGLEDGLYRASCFPEMMLWSEPFNTFYQMAYRWIDEDVNQVHERAVKFKNGYAMVMIYFYHSSFFLVPYAVFCLFFCVFLFLAVVLFFVGKKLNHIVRLEQAVLQMSSGDLTTAVPKAGGDEIGVLALELDKLRLTLHENFLQEQEAHKSNRELITALSHDLRTPLTILKGYLEILNLNRNPQLEAEYIGRCLKKADDLKEMTDRMFEYALVFDEAADLAGEPDIAMLPVSFFLDGLREHADFLRLAGFKVELCFPEEENLCAGCAAAAEETMVKRVLNNLFSNIIKYADKKEAVSIEVLAEEVLVISVKNRIKDPDGENSHMERTQIGLKSVRSMMDKMNGELYLQMEERIFMAKLRFCMEGGDLLRFS